MMERVKIKICGLTSIADCQAVNIALPDYAGFVMTRSRRRVSSARASELSGFLDSSIRPIGVFADEPAAYICDAATAAGLMGVQLHGIIDTDKIVTLRRFLPGDTVIWQRLPVNLEYPSQISLMSIQREIERLEGSQAEPDAWLLDSCRSGRIGGTGDFFDWTAFSGLHHKLPLAVAGGLNQDNVGRAIQALLPCMVDCSSGVETGGTKDMAKILSFCRAVRTEKGGT